MADNYVSYPKYLTVIIILCSGIFAIPYPKEILAQIIAEPKQARIVFYFGVFVQKTFKYSNGLKAKSLTRCNLKREIFWT